MKYFVLKTSASEGGVIGGYPTGSPADWKFSKGESLARQFPKGASVSFSSTFPDFRKVYDFQANTLNALLVSSRARQAIEALPVANAEFLPVTVKDHSGAAVGEYAFLNLLGAEDAIDLERSDYKLSHINKEEIARIKKLVLKPSGINPEARMFRCTRKLPLILIREDVREAFVQAGLTGWRTWEADGWNGMEL